jgi:hypothetical protein
MENVLFLIGVLACPLAMLAMGGVAWVSGKALGHRNSDASGDDTRVKAIHG